MPCSHQNVIVSAFLCFENGKLLRERGRLIFSHPLGNTVAVGCILGFSLATVTSRPVSSKGLLSNL